MAEGKGPPVLPGLIPTFPQIGCEDGSVKLFQVVPGGIQFERNLDRRKGECGRARCCSGIVPLSLPVVPVPVTKGLRVRRVTSGTSFLAGRILCLSWHPSDTHIAAGSVDIVRVFDVRSGNSCSGG